MVAMASFPVALGVVVLALVVIGALAGITPDSPGEDRAAPYREGLHAANRMQRVAQDLEQQIYAEAAQQIESDRGGQPQCTRIENS
jgi:hypothetical protein